MVKEFPTGPLYGKGEPMLKSKSIICFANDFRGDPTSKQQVMKILSENNTILWINSIAMRRPSASVADMSRLWSKVTKFFKGLDQINKNLYVFTPLVLPLPSLKFAQLLNKFLLLSYLKFFIWKLKMKNIQLWTFVPNMISLVGKLGEEKVIYYCVDEWSEFSFLDRETIVRLEKELLLKSDVVITTAKKLYESKIKHNSRTYLVPHGVDFDFFSQALKPSFYVPDDIEILPNPRIGFFGLIHEWVDLGLIEFMAQKHPEWSIVMIGKLVPGIDISRSSAFKNIHFMGQKDYSELPHYCKGLDVALIPFKINELTLNVNPIKLREYLAAGLPVVSTPLPEIIPYKDVVYLAESKEEFTSS